jgi:hypothetical protein
MTRTTPLLVLVALGSCLTACSDEPAELPRGSIQVSWLVGTGGCDASGVADVAVVLNGGESGTSIRTYSCNQGQATLTDLEPGTYDISLRARDSAGVGRFGGTASNVVVRSEGTTTVPTVRLNALPATIQVTWYFENGRFCAYNNVETVEITLFEDEYEIYSTSVACDAGEAFLEDQQADTYIVDLLGRDPDGLARYNGQDEVTVNRGDSVAVELRLDEIINQTPQ